MEFTLVTLLNGLSYGLLLFMLYTTTFPIYRGFMMLIAFLMLVSIYLGLTRTRVGLVVQAALTNPNAVEALGHNVPRALLASLLIGVLQTYAVALDYSVLSLLSLLDAGVSAATPGYALLTLSISQCAPILPYLLLILILTFGPKGLMGAREG